ncbi:MAG: homocysteine S-methyltransferase family protein [Candidatus Eiseniibacteriota bacterium]|jgi:5-methyltetrahydrofolate--homocysteine methyltransferase
MQPFLDRVRAGETLVGDGAMGTMLLGRGLGPGDCPEELVLERPELLGEIAQAFLDAGADIVQTDTFGGSPLKLALYDLEDRAAELNRRAVELVRDVVGDRAHVSGSCGPSGKLLQPYGDTAPDAMLASFRVQIEALAGAGVDLLCIETMTDLDEATLAIRAARQVAPALPIIATMTFDATPRGFFTIMGQSIERSVDGLVAAGADLIGSNCGNGIERMVEVARAMRQHTDHPLVIQSNAGLPDLRDGRLVYDESPEFMAARVPTLLELGVSVIGGCCGTTPEHVRAIRRAIDPARSGEA